MRRAQARIDAFARRYQHELPSAVKCLLSDRQALTAYLRFPAEQWRRIRHTNLIERTFGETRRRVKVIGRLSGEASCLSLVWAVLDRASRGWGGLTYTQPSPGTSTSYATNSIPTTPGTASPPRLSPPPRSMTIGTCARTTVTPDLGRRLALELGAR